MEIVAPGFGLQRLIFELRIHCAESGKHLRHYRLLTKLAASGYDFPGTAKPERFQQPLARQRSS